MRKAILHLLAAGFLAVASLTLVLPAPAAESAKPDASAKEPKVKSIVPFHGKISAVNKTAKTITLEGKVNSRVIQITSETKIVKAGKPAVFDDATVGEEVGGRGQQKDGKMEAVSLRIGPKSESQAEPAPKQKAGKSQKPRPKKEKEKTEK